MSYTGINRFEGLQNWGSTPQQRVKWAQGYTGRMENQMQKTINRKSNGNWVTCRLTGIVAGNMWMSPEPSMPLSMPNHDDHCQAVKVEVC